MYGLVLEFRCVLLSLIGSNTHMSPYTSFPDKPPIKYKAPDVDVYDETACPILGNGELYSLSFFQGVST